MGELEIANRFDLPRFLELLEAKGLMRGVAGKSWAEALDMVKEEMKSSKASESGKYEALIKVFEAVKKMRHARGYKDPTSDVPELEEILKGRPYYVPLPASFLEEAELAVRSEERQTYRLIIDRTNEFDGLGKRIVNSGPVLMFEQIAYSPVKGHEMHLLLAAPLFGPRARGAEESKLQKSFSLSVSAKRIVGTVRHLIRRSSK